MDENPFTKAMNNATRTKLKHAVEVACAEAKAAGLPDFTISDELVGQAIQMQMRNLRTGIYWFDAAVEIMNSSRDTFRNMIFDVKSIIATPHPTHRDD